MTEFNNQNEEAIPEADAVLNAQIDALRASVSDLVNAAGGHEEFAAAFSAMRQVSSNIDMEQMLNTIHMPAEAGQYAPILRKMMERIPNGWGRWIECGPGWYPIIAQLDYELAQLNPDYVIHQVKEKYGELRFYYSLNLTVHDPADPAPEFYNKVRQKLELTEEERERQNDEVIAWLERGRQFAASPAGEEMTAEYKALYDQAQALVDAAEYLCSLTCEDCGADGELRLTLGPSPWYKTLCEDCVEEEGGGYVTQSVWEAWWKQEGPRIEQEMEERRLKYFLDSHRDKKILVVSSNPGHTLVVDAAYANDDESFDLYIQDLNEWDAIFFDVESPLSRRLMERVEEQYRDHIRANKERDQKNSNLYPRPEGAPVMNMIGWSRESITAPLHNAGISISCYHSGHVCFEKSLGEKKD